MGHISAIWNWKSYKAAVKISQAQISLLKKVTHIAYNQTVPPCHKRTSGHVSCVSCCNKFFKVIVYFSRHWFNIGVSDQRQILCRKCEHICIVDTYTADVTCGCREGFQLQNDNISCRGERITTVILKAHAMTLIYIFHMWVTEVNLRPEAFRKC